MAKSNSTKSNYIALTSTVIDREKATFLCKREFRKTFVSTLIMSIVLFVLGAGTIVMALLAEDVSILQLIIGGLVTAFSIYPIFSVIKAQNLNIKNSISNMHLDNGEILIEMQFYNKRIEVATTKDEISENKTIMIKNLENARIDGDYLYLYLNNGKMYSITRDEVIFGSLDKIISTLKNNGVAVKGK